MSHKNTWKRLVVLFVLVLPFAISMVACDDGDSNDAETPTPELVPLLEAVGNAVDNAQECPNSTICWNATTVCKNPENAGCDDVWQGIADTCEVCEG